MRHSDSPLEVSESSEQVSCQKKNLVSQGLFGPILALTRDNNKRKTTITVITSDVAFAVVLNVSKKTANNLFKFNTYKIPAYKT